MCLCACVQAEMIAARMVLSEEARDQALMQLLCCYGFLVCFCCVRSKRSRSAASVFQNPQGCHGSNLIAGGAPDEIANKLSCPSSRR